mgnify:CR=1 FL=1
MSTNKKVALILNDINWITDRYTAFKNGGAGVVIRNLYLTLIEKLNCQVDIYSKKISQYRAVACLGVNTDNMGNLCSYRNFKTEDAYVKAYTGNGVGPWNKPMGFCQLFKHLFTILCGCYSTLYTFGL